MELIIRAGGDQPIYDQIRSQIRAQILAGTLPPNTPLPSIRTLAKDLRISVITTRRAYDELEQEGLLVSIPGKGCFVAEQDVSAMREQQIQDVETLLREAIQQGRACGLGTSDLLAIVQKLLAEQP